MAGRESGEIESIRPFVLVANWVNSAWFFILMILIHLVFSLIEGWYRAEKGYDLHGVCVSFRLAITMADEHLQVSLLSFSRLLFSPRKARRSTAASSNLIHCS